MRSRERKLLQKRRMKLALHKGAGGAGLGGEQCKQFGFREESGYTLRNALPAASNRPVREECNPHPLRLKHFDQGTDKGCTAIAR